MPAPDPAYPPDRLFASPWLEPLVSGVRRAYRWDACYLSRVRLHHWLAYWNPTPGATVAANGRSLALDRRVLVLIPAGTWLQRSAQQPFDHWWYHFRLAAEPLRPGAQVLAVDQRLGARLARAWDLAWAGGAATAASTAAGQAVLATALDRVEWREAAASADPRFTTLLAALASEDHPHLANPALAARLDMHPTAFCRRFRQLVGMPPQDWLREGRLGTAARRLAEGLSVEEVADLGGFSDRYHFGRLFRTYSGISPGRYRALTVRTAPGG